MTVSLKVLSGFLLFVFILSGCSGPARFVSREEIQKRNLIKVDSVRIKKSFDRIKDSASYYAQDLEFSQEEIEESETEKGSEINITLDDFLSKYKSSTFTSLPTEQEKIVMSIISYFGTKYKYGGITRKGIDCSAFTQTVFKEALNYQLPRSSLEQYKNGEVIEEAADLKFGDLVFFNTRRRQRPGHVGIYLWDNLFAHSGSSSGVTISSLGEGYYNKRFMGGRRLEDINFSQ